MEMEQFTYKTVNLMPPKWRDKTFLSVAMSRVDL